jgi:hypothetical protein
MSARRRSRELEKEVTARPRPISQELRRPPVAEAGLSVDPEDLGRQFLSEATQQQNFESSDGGDASELSIVEGAPSDDALTGPSFDPDHDVWEQTVDLDLESGGVDQLTADASGTVLDEDLGNDRNDRNDTSDPSTREGSLLDEEDEPSRSP